MEDLDLDLDLVMAEAEEDLEDVEEMEKAKGVEWFYFKGDEKKWVFIVDALVRGGVSRTLFDNVNIDIIAKRFSDYCNSFQQFSSKTPRILLNDLSVYLESILKVTSKKRAPKDFRVRSRATNSLWYESLGLTPRINAAHSIVELGENGKLSIHKPGFSYATLVSLEEAARLTAYTIRFKIGMETATTLAIADYEDVSKFLICHFLDCATLAPVFLLEEKQGILEVVEN